MTEPSQPVDTFALLQGRPDDPPNIKMLRFAVIGMSIVLVLGLLTMIGRIAYLAMRPSAGTISAGSPQSSAQPLIAAPLAADVRLALPAGATVRSQSLAGTMLSVHYGAPAGEGIMILDLVTGRTASHVRIQSEK